jgi:transcriptional regulator with XRE-family HTH domain
MTLAARIRKRMEEKGWTLADLSRESQVAKGYLWEILDGRAKKPSAETLYRIAAALGTSVADLLGRPPAQPASAELQVAAELRALADDLNLPEEDVQMLAASRFRKEQPKTKEGWRFLYESIRRSIRE